MKCIAKESIHMLAHDNYQNVHIVCGWPNLSIGGYPLPMQVMCACVGGFRFVVGLTFWKLSMDGNEEGFRCVLVEPIGENSVINSFLPLTLKELPSSG